MLPQELFRQCTKVTEARLSTDASDFMAFSSIWQYEEKLELNQYKELLIKLFLLQCLLALDRHVQTMALKAHCLKRKYFPVPLKFYGTHLQFMTCIIKPFLQYMLLRVIWVHCKVYIMGFMMHTIVLVVR